MGYKPQGKIYDLTFTDRPGLEVKCKGATLGEIEYVRGLSPNMNEPDPEKRLAIFSFFNKKVITWNVDHPAIESPTVLGQCPNCGLKEDEPMPCSVTTMQCVEVDFIMSIIIGWVFAVARVPIPKGMSLPNGGTSGQGSPLPDGLTTAIMEQLETLQNPSKLPELSFTSD